MRLSVPALAFGLVLAAGAGQARADHDQALAVVGALPSAGVCVAYHAEKHMFFVRSVEVVGKNCDVTLRREAGQVTLTVPVDRFDSGNGKRDRHVASILGGEEHAPLVLTAQVPATTPAGSFTVPGTLTVAGTAHALTLTVEPAQRGARRGWMVYADTSFPALAIEVPSVGPGGLIASPKDDLGLYAWLPAETWTRSAE